MRWPAGRGNTPRQNGVCVHEWQQRAEGGYQCRRCGTERGVCPHDWAWHSAEQVWCCQVCGAEQGEDHDRGGR